MADTDGFIVENLGVCKIQNPSGYSLVTGDQLARYVSDEEGIVYDVTGVAGAGQEYMHSSGGTDASGNKRLGDIGLVNNHFVHLPIPVAVASRHYTDPESSLWRDVIEATR